MSNEQKDPKAENNNYQVAIWLTIGAGLGTVLGVLYHNIPIGIIMGAALGLVFGAAMAQTKKK